jgi:hypothetical protein
MENEKSSSSVLMNKIANETGAEKSECESFFKWWFSQIRGVTKIYKQWSSVNVCKKKKQVNCVYQKKITPRAAL